MKAIKLNLSLLFAALLAVGMTPLQAQQNDKTNEQKQVTIIKKYIDEDGVEVTEKIVSDGEDVIIDAHDGLDVDYDINVNDEAEHKVIRIRSIGDDGELKVIEWDGDGELPDDIQIHLDQLKKDCKLKGAAAHDKAYHRYHFKSDENKAFLGVVIGKKVKNIDGEETVEGVSEKGVLLSKVVEGSAADAAGLLANDIITALDGQDVRDFGELSEIIKNKKPGDQLAISYLRNDQPATTTATLKANESKSYGYSMDKEEMDFMRGARFAHRERPCVFIGVYVDNSRDEDGQDLGAHVNGIIENTPAQEAGLQEDDIITSVNGVTINTYGELLKERNKYNPGDEVSISYIRSGASNTVNIKFRECGEREEEPLYWFDNEDFNFEFDNDEDAHTKVIIIKKKQGEATEEGIIEQPGKEEIEIEPTAPIIAAPILSLENFRAFPNPTNGSVTVRFNGEAVPTAISIVDVSGREVFREDLEDFNGTYNQRVNLNDAPTGTLLLTVQQGDQVFTKKIILNRA